MAKITHSQVEAAYDLASKVFDSKVEFEVAARSLRDDFGLNINSARDFIGQFRHMMRGEVFTRTQNAYALEYFLTRIEKDRGSEAIVNAISAAWQHVEYYEQAGKQKTRLRKFRAVLELRHALMQNAVIDKTQVERFYADVDQSLKDTQAQRKKRLATAGKKPGIFIARTKVYIRNADVVAEVLFRAAGSCEGCGKSAPFKRRSNGEPYLEVHHKIQLAHDGEDTVENALALCPNCHRKSHYGMP